MKRDAAEQLLLDAWDEFDLVKTHIAQRWPDPPPTLLVHQIVEQTRVAVIDLLRSRILTHRRGWWSVFARRHECPTRVSVIDVYLDALVDPDKRPGAVRSPVPTFTGRDAAS